MITFDTVIAHLWHYRRACLTYGWMPSVVGLLAYIGQRESGHRGLWEAPQPMKLAMGEQIQGGML